MSWDLGRWDTGPVPGRLAHLGHGSGLWALGSGHWAPGPWAPETLGSKGLGAPWGEGKQEAKLVFWACL